VETFSPQWWSEWWLEVTGGTASAVVAAALLSALSKSVREHFWKPMGRGIVWLAGLRPSTKKQREDHARLALEAETLRVDLSASQAAAEEYRSRLAEVEGLLEELQSARLESEVRTLARQVAEAATAPNVIDGGSAAGPSLPRPDPRWGVYRNPNTNSRNDFFVVNLVPRSIAKEVRLEVLRGSFHILDSGHWEDMSVPADEKNSIKPFKGFANAASLMYGIDFQISWYDENNKQHFAEVSLPEEDAPF